MIDEEEEWECLICNEKIKTKKGNVIVDLQEHYKEKHSKLYEEDMKKLNVLL